jgi:hypothetical protein
MIHLLFDLSKVLLREGGLRLALFAGMVCLAVQSPLTAQNLPGSIPRNPMGQPNPQSPAGRLGGVPLDDPLDNEKAYRATNADRQKSIVSDTDKLMKLVSQLDAEVARSGAEKLSSAQLRKMAEIEKLAHDVKVKMSTSVSGPPAFSPPFVRSR